MTWSIPLTDVVVPEEDVKAVLEVYRSGWLTMGPRTQAFEAALQDFTGATHAVCVSSGTAALHLAMEAAGIGPGDEVLVPAWTFVAGVEAVRFVGATPVLCEARGPHDPNIDPDDARTRITPRTKAVLATHMMGYPCDVAALETLGVTVLEDAAQAIGATLPDGRQAGTASVAGCISFFSKKQLTTGEGGVVLTADEGIADRVRSLRSHAMTSGTWSRHRGHADSYDVLDIGFNFRLDEPRAALGLSRLARLRADIDRRRVLVRRYRELLAGAPGITIPWDDEALVERSSHFCFAVLLDSRSERDRIKAALTERGIQTTGYPAITSFSGYADHGRRPRAEEVAGRHLALPLAASFDEAQVEQVCAALREIV